MDNIDTNIYIHNKNNLLEFWRIYDSHGITIALEWLEINKYRNDINYLETNELNTIFKNINIS